MGQRADATSVHSSSSQQHARASLADRVVSTQILIGDDTQNDFFLGRNEDGNPLINWDVNDYSWYDQTSNRLHTYIDNTDVFSIDPVNVITPLVLNSPRYAVGSTEGSDFYLTTVLGNPVINFAPNNYMGFNATASTIFDVVEGETVLERNPNRIIAHKPIKVAEYDTDNPSPTLEEGDVFWKSDALRYGETGSSGSGAFSLYDGASLLELVDKASILGGLGGIRSKTAHGYIDLGPENANHAHIYTDRPNFYFNKPILVNGDELVTTGNSVIAGTLGFGSSTRQMINLWSTSYGVGIQSYTPYIRTGKYFAVHKGGSHNDAALDPGGGTNIFYVSDEKAYFKGVVQASAFYRKDGIQAVVLLPEGGVEQRGEGTKVGAIKISLPTTAPNHTMMTMRVRAYMYSPGRSFDMMIAGYFTGSYWLHTSAHICGEQVDYPVRFGFDGTRKCIWIGETSAVWNYLNLTVMDFTGGYGGADTEKWREGWDVDVVSTFNTVETGVTRTKTQVGKYVDGNITWHSGHTNINAPRLTIGYDTSASFYLEAQAVTNVPIINFAANDYIAYHLSSNILSFYISGVESLKIKSTRLELGVPLKLVKYTVSALPSGETGDCAYVTDGRKNGEAAGAGSGVQAFYDGSNWIASDSGVAVAS